MAASDLLVDPGDCRTDRSRVSIKKIEKVLGLLENGEDSVVVGKMKTELYEV
jgi:hypothetical protein